MLPSPPPRPSLLDPPEPPERDDLSPPLPARVAAALSSPLPPPVAGPLPPTFRLPSNAVMSQGLEPGDVVLGNWRLLYVAGQGASGVTWRATPLDGGPDVALKAVYTGGPGDMHHENLLREAALLRQLHHPAVLRYLGVVDMPGTLLTWLITEWVDGGDLSDWIPRNAPVSPPRARALLLQVVDALEFLHARGVIHRDLKPANILVRAATEGPPRLCVADFGISRRMHGGSAPATRPADTPGYAPPEAWGPAPLSGAADVFGLGAILWYLLTGQEPVPGPGDCSPRASLLEGSLDQIVPRPARSLARLALEMMAADPLARPSLARLREELERSEPLSEPTAGTLLPLPVPIPPPPPTTALPEPPRRPRREPSLRLAALLAILFGLISGGVVSWLRFYDSRAPSAVDSSAPAVPAEGAVSPAPTPGPPGPPDASPEPAPLPTASPATPPSSPPRINPSSDPEPSAPTLAVRTPPATPVAELRVGLRAPAGLPADAAVVVRAANGASTRSRSTTLTLRDTRAGAVVVQVVGAAGVIAEAGVTVPGGDVVRVLCSAPSSDFKGLHCDVL